MPGQVDERNFDPDDPIIEDVVLLEVDVPGSDLTDVLVDAFKPGYPFEIARIEHFAGTVTATMSYDVKVEDSSVLANAETPANSTREEADLADARSSRRGSVSDEIGLFITTDGTGDVDRLRVRVHLRPYPAGAE